MLRCVWMISSSAAIWWSKVSPRIFHLNQSIPTADLIIASLEHLNDWSKDFHLFLNGHDDLITDLPDRIAATHQNLIRRMGKAVKALSESVTIAEACTAVYGQASGYQHLLMIEKTGAYIEHLYEPVSGNIYETFVASHSFTFRFFIQQWR